MTATTYQFTIEFVRPDADRPDVATFAHRSDAYDSAARAANEHGVTVLVLRNGMLYGKVEPSDERALAPAFPRDHNSPTTNVRPTTSAKNPSGLDRLLRRPTERLAEIARRAAMPKVKTFRISFAYGNDFQPSALLTHREQYELALKLQGSLSRDGAPLDIGISFGYGAGSWGCEQCVHIETATPNDITDWLTHLLNNCGQDCAYVNIDGKPFELNIAGEWYPITGRIDS